MSGEETGWVIRMKTSISLDGHFSVLDHRSHLMDVLGSDPRILHTLVAGLLGALEQVIDQLLKLGACDRHGQMLRA